MQLLWFIEIRSNSKMINDSETIVFIFLKLVAIPPTAPE